MRIRAIKEGKSWCAYRKKGFCLKNATREKTENVAPFVTKESIFFTLTKSSWKQERERLKIQRKMGRKKEATKWGIPSKGRWKEGGLIKRGQKEGGQKEGGQEEGGGIKRGQEEGGHIKKACLAHKQESCSLIEKEKSAPPPIWLQSLQIPCALFLPGELISMSI